MGKFISVAILITFCSVEFPKFFDAYFVDNPSQNSVAFGDGNKQMIEYVKNHESAYDRIIISGYYWRPYIFFLYWKNVNPKDYQRSGSREQHGKYLFTAASWDTNGIKLMDPSFDANTLESSQKTLYIVAPKELEIQKKHLKEIDQINGRRKDRIFVASVEQ